MKAGCIDDKKQNSHGNFYTGSLIWGMYTLSWRYGGGRKRQLGRSDCRNTGKPKFIRLSGGPDSDRYLQRRKLIRGKTRGNSGKVCGIGTPLSKHLCQRGKEAPLRLGHQKSRLNSSGDYPAFLERSEEFYAFWNSVQNGVDAETSYWEVSDSGGLNYYEFQ